MNIDKVMNIFWFVFGLFIMTEGYRFNLGTLHKPDSGLFPFLIGMVIIILSSILLIQTVGKKSQQEEKKERTNYGNILLTLLSLYTYALVFEWLGFILSTFLLISFLLKVIEQRGWVITIFLALLTSSCSYALFEVWLHATLPKGILGI